MNKTEISRQIGGTEDGYVFNTMLPESIRQQVLRLTTILKNSFGEAVWVAPENSLHITLCDILKPQSYPFDKEHYYQSNQQLYELAAGRIIKDYAPITVSFKRIVVRPQAITIEGDDDGSFARLRAQLVTVVPIPEQTGPPPNIIHSSIARFTQTVDLGPIERLMNSQILDHTVAITNFQLVHNIVSPMLSYDVIRTYPLSA